MQKSPLHSTRPANGPKCCFCIPARGGLAFLNGLGIFLTVVSLGMYMCLFALGHGSLIMQRIGVASLILFLVYAGQSAFTLCALVKNRADLLRVAASWALVMLFVNTLATVLRNTLPDEVNIFGEHDFGDDVERTRALVVVIGIPLGILLQTYLTVVVWKVYFYARAREMGSHYLGFFVEMNRRGGDGVEIVHKV